MSPLKADCCRRSRGGVTSAAKTGTTNKGHSSGARIRPRMRWIRNGPTSAVERPDKREPGRFPLVPRSHATAWPRDFRSSPQRVSGLSLARALDAAREQDEPDHDQQRRQRGLAEPAVVVAADVQHSAEDHEGDHEDDCRYEHQHSALPEQLGIVVADALQVETEADTAGRDQRPREAPGGPIAGTALIRKDQPDHGQDRAWYQRAGVDAEAAAPEKRQAWND